ncbi:MAG: hypothetical protein CVV64_09385 [Candidatus Wallbacteria bacterium HGW-Wallbacteria-1]|jgi:hypothetical protein|uniref:Uncharacterized protein n=1 Tax=Candidatus Wallbacteria bacterium HGW-Wallbacteria-1 TaxID=2013854 RepID=A0A2N1PQE5_9BACT|nr:MAG: hypothetical protein CVV64_09385 [Candidatus Wallbacteria bacterium HGW-Wallbacteria-1]
MSAYVLYRINDKIEDFRGIASLCELITAAFIMAMLWSLPDLKIPDGQNQAIHKSNAMAMVDSFLDQAEHLSAQYGRSIRIILNHEDSGTRAFIMEPWLKSGKSLLIPAVWISAQADTMQSSNSMNGQLSKTFLKESSMDSKNKRNDGFNDDSPEGFTSEESDSQLLITINSDHPENLQLCVSEIPPTGMNLSHPEILNYLKQGESVTLNRGR